MQCTVRAFERTDIMLAQISCFFWMSAGYSLLHESKVTGRLYVLRLSFDVGRWRWLSCSCLRDSQTLNRWIKCWTMAALTVAWRQFHGHEKLLRVLSLLVALFPCFLVGTLWTSQLAWHWRGVIWCSLDGPNVYGSGQQPFYWGGVLYWNSGALFRSPANRIFLLPKKVPATRLETRNHKRILLSN